MAKEIIGDNRRRYLNGFTLLQRKEALNISIEVRKLEFELYWKKAAFGLTLIGVAFGGYFALQKDGGSVAKFAVGCLGILAAIAWYCTNRASAASLRHWEIHVEILEDEFIGPLFKKALPRGAFPFWRLILPYPHSPQRINNILGLTLALVWSLLLIWTVLNSFVYQSAVAKLPNAQFFDRLLFVINAPSPNVITALCLSGVTMAAAISVLCARIMDPKEYRIKTNFMDRKFDDGHTEWQWPPFGFESKTSDLDEKIGDSKLER